MSDNGLTFEWSATAPAAPPRRGRGAGQEWVKPATMLAEHPGEWAIIYRGEHKVALNIASRVRSGRIAAFKTEDGAYESSERDGAVFARFVSAGAE